MNHFSAPMSAKPGLIVILAVLMSGCGLLGPSSTDVSAELAFCSDEVNRYRAAAGLRALERSAALEAYAAESARVDHAANTPHQHFTQTNGGGVALAETELLSWSTRDVHSVIERGVRGMWSERPTGEHYVILAGDYSQIGCGVFLTSEGVTVAQGFR